VCGPRRFGCGRQRRAGPVWVVKSQIPSRWPRQRKVKEKSAGDKGRRAHRPKSVPRVMSAQGDAGATLVTLQTGSPHGKQVKSLYIEDGSDIDKEFYLSILVNRETAERS